MGGAGAPLLPRPPDADVAGHPLTQAFLTREFWDSLDGKRPLHVPGAAQAFAAGFTVDQVAEALARGSESGATTALKRGDPYMRDNIFLAYLDQASLALAGAERFFPQLLELCEALATGAFDHVTVRLVLEPPDCAGPPLLADADFLAVQLWGEQRLVLARPTRGLRVSAPRPEPLLAARLVPGDVLLVPAGVEVRSSRADAAPQHRSSSSTSPGGPAAGAAATAAAEGPLLYALLTLRTSDHSVSSSLAKYLNDLLRDGRLSEDADAFFRSSVTKRTLAGGYAGSTELAEKLGRSAEELAARVTAAGLREHYAARMAALRAEQRREAAKIASTPPATVGLTGASRVRISVGVTCRCYPGDSVACFKRGTETLNLPIATTASHLINRLSDGKPHPVASLPCADPFERLCVCQILLFKGCLETA